MDPIVQCPGWIIDDVPHPEDTVDSFLDTFLYTLIPVAATIIGGIIAAFRTPSRQVGSAIQHFAAGVVFAAVAAELLPEISAAHATVSVVLGFSAGVAVVLTVRHLTEGAHGESGGQENTSGLLAAVAIDLVIDGFLVGIGFSAGEQTGILLTIALTLEVLFLGLSVAATLGAAGASRARVIATTTGLALLLGVSAAIGVALLGGLSGGLEAAILAFGAAALLYLVTEELLVEAHEVRETPFTTAVFFAGFLLLFILDGMI